MQEITFKQINRLAIPAIISGIAEPIISLVDTAIIGHLGTVQLGAVGVASSFFLLIIWVLSQTKSAISAIVSQAYGANNMERIGGLITQATAINLLLGLLVIGLTVPFLDSIFKIYGANGVLLKHAKDYFEIRALGFPIVLVTFGLFGIFRGIQNTSWAMQVSIVGGVVNLLLDVLLVYGVEGIIPSMGVKGAAWASLSAQLVMLILTFYFFFRKTALTFSWSIKLHSELKKLASISGNLFIRTLSLNVAYFTAVKLATGYGAEYIAAHTIAMNIWLFSSFFIDGYANAGNAMSGKLLGAQDFESLKKLGKSISKVSVIIGAILGCVYLLCYPIMGSIFASDKQVIFQFNLIFWMVIISQPINGIAFGYDGIFKGLGEAKYLRNTLFLATFVCFVPVVLMGHYLDWKLLGIWLAFVLWMIFRGATLWWRFGKFIDEKDDLVYASKKRG